MIFEKRQVSKRDMDEMMNFVVTLREDDTYIAWCPLLDESSEGYTPEEAKKGLKHAIKLRLQDKNMPIPRARIEGISMMSVSIRPSEHIGERYGRYRKDTQAVRT